MENEQLQEKVKNIFSNFLEQKHPPIFRIQIENRYFNLATLMPLGMILNELLTNSIKYASDLKKQLQKILMPCPSF